MTTDKQCTVCHKLLSECGHPADLKDLLGAERAVRKLLWRLKRLGIPPEMVLVHGKNAEFALGDSLEREALVAAGEDKPSAQEAGR